MREQVPVEKLAVGMFVAELDRPWLGTPFLIQGFAIDSQEQIEEFRRLCKHVFVERSLSLGDQYIADPVEKKVVAPRSRPEPRVQIYKDDKAGGGQTDAGLIGSIGKIFKSAFSADGQPAPEARRAQPLGERAPRVIVYQDDKGATRRKPAPEASATREKGMSSEERGFLERAVDPDASVHVYGRGTPATRHRGAGLRGPDHHRRRIADGTRGP